MAAARESRCGICPAQGGSGIHAHRASGFYRYHHTFDCGVAAGLDQAASFCAGTGLPEQSSATHGRLPLVRAGPHRTTARAGIGTSPLAKWTRPLSHRDWLRGDWTVVEQPQPPHGTLFGYVSRSPSLYRCPSLTSSAPPASAAHRPGHRQQRAIRLCFHARPDRAPASVPPSNPMSQVHSFPTGHLENFRHSRHCRRRSLLSSTAFSSRAWHAASDAMSHTHHGGAFYASIDGSVHWINEPPGGCSIWLSQTPSGKWVSFSPYPFLWGQWNLQ